MKIKHFRWWIAVLLAAATALNYLDRQSFPIAVDSISESIPISDQQFGYFQSLFLIGYGLMYAVGGRIMDWLGTRIGYTVMIVWWSLAAMMHGLVSGIVGLGIARVLLGLGEGGGFPGSAKAVSEWFSSKERSLAFGIFNTGSAVGMVAAVPLVTVLVLTLGWRWVFIITGLAGLVWAVIWLFAYGQPETHPLVTEEERAKARDELAAPARSGPDGAAAKTRWIDLLRYRQVWALLVAKFLTDAAWWFLIFWLPKYLGGARNFDLKDVGTYGWIPYVGAGVGSLFGGYLSSWLMQRGFKLDRARKISLAIPAGLMPLTILIDWSPLWLLLILYTIGLLAHQFWSTIIQTLAADLFPSSQVGSFAGLLGAVGSLGGALYQLVVGMLVVAMGSYNLVFVISGLLHPLSFLLILLVVREIRMLPQGDKV